ncbi:hypothetical protein C5167_037126 [Papaver somniferum]|uniref:TraB domain-containing protein n=1 Tax=Papaver somniferum TaxID=3469 RepID=A0A4Y7I8M3_PAPSO|nr:hypothetical protein C5167_037126 [Papaver somniferum]
MSSSICDDPLRVSITNLSHQSTQDETSHYQHGIPGIPTDGKVVLLKNSNNGAQIYLVGTVHIRKESAEIVKKVIDNVTPDVVAVELCKGRADGLMNWKPEDDTLYKLFCRSMRSPGGLCMKVVNFIVSCWYCRLHAGGIFPGLEFKVAMEESSRVGARCSYIDQDHDVLILIFFVLSLVTLQQLSKVSSYGLLWKAYTRLRDEVKKSRQVIKHHSDIVNGQYTRSNVQEIVNILKIICPEIASYLRKRHELTSFGAFGA